MNPRVLPILCALGLLASSPAFAATPPKTVGHLRQQLASVTKQRDRENKQLARSAAALKAMTYSRDQWKADAAGANKLLITAVEKYDVAARGLATASAALTASTEGQIGAMTAVELWRIVGDINTRFLGLADPSYKATSSTAGTSTTYDFVFKPAASASGG
jgi:uncharacterized protein